MPLGYAPMLLVVAGFGFGVQTGGEEPFFIDIEHDRGSSKFRKNANVYPMPQSELQWRQCFLPIRRVQNLRILQLCRELQRANREASFITVEMHQMRRKLPDAAHL